MVVCAAAALVTAQGAIPASAVRGVDVSHWNGTVGWSELVGGGNSFAFAKATEGRALSDLTYVLNRAGARSVGVRFGAYHFARPAGADDASITAGAIAQADRFVTFAQPKPGDLLPALDLEASGGLSPARLAEWTQAWLDEVQARLAVKPLIYTGLNFWRSRLADTSVFASAGYRLWYARYTTAANPSAPAGNWGGFGWTFWQWTNCAHLRGIAGCVDADRFHGNTVSAATIPPAVPAPPSVTSPPAIVGAPQIGHLLAAVPGLWLGAEPISFGYQWERCDAAGNGCVVIPASIAETYSPRSPDLGHALAVQVAARNAVGSSSAVSPATLAVAAAGSSPGSAPTVVTAPTIVGTAQAGQTLTSLVGLWRGSPTQFGYQWRRCARNGAACSLIAGATNSSYTPLAPDIGKALSLAVIAKNRGGSRTALSPRTAAVAPAPVPKASIGSAVAVAAQAGAVTTPGGDVTVTWQPGAVAAKTTVGLQPAPLRLGRLALPKTAVVLSLGRTPTGAGSSKLAWPVDVSFVSGTAAAVAGFSANESIWHPVPSLAGPSLPAGIHTGAYRDTAGALHMLTLQAGGLGLFRPASWGDPRFTTGSGPRLRRADGRSTPLTASPTHPGVTVTTRFSVDEQARLSASVLDPHSRRLLLLPTGSILGRAVSGLPTRTIQALMLTLGGVPLQLHLAKKPSSGTYRIRIVASDPYARRALLEISLRIS
jgi:GH25 family lysozyme M1 (1,4-beta-N-acetylmuramidase)